MGVNTTGLLNTQTEVYASYKNDAVTKNETAAKKDSTAKTEEKNESGVVYDKSDSSKDNKKATYSINKMSAEDRAPMPKNIRSKIPHMPVSPLPAEPAQNLFRSLLNFEAG